MKVCESPTVSIVLLNYNGRKFADFWRSLFLLTYSKPRYEIVFVDNGSYDGSDILFTKMASEFQDIQVETIKLKENCGYSKANNLGVEKAHGEYVVLLSNDIKVSKDWLKNAIEVLESDPQIGVAQSIMYMLDKPSEPDKMGNYIDLLGLNHPFVFSDKIREVFYSEGAVMFVRRQLIDEACGLFDERYFMFYEDIDFCWRARLLGYKVVVLPSSVVYHRRGGTVSGILMKTDPIYVFTNTRNRLVTLAKNYSTTNLIRYIPPAIVMEIAKGFLLMTNGKIQAGLAGFRGIFSFVNDFRSTMERRVVIQSKRKVDDKSIIKFMVPMKQAIRDTFENVKRLRDEWRTQ